MTIKGVFRKIGEWIVEKTTDSFFDSNITAMHTFNGKLYIATQKGTLYIGEGRHWKVCRK